MKQAWHCIWSDMAYALPMSASLAIMTACIAFGGDGWPPFTFAAEPWSLASGGNGRTYAIVVVPEAWSWHDARDLAQAAGGDLVALRSPSELAFVSGLAQSAAAFSCVGPWIGGYRAAGGRWMLVDGSPLDGFAWQPGRPSQSTLLDAALCLLGDGAPDGTWADVLPGPGGGASVTSAVVRWESFVDCDGDGRPDAMEILADRSLDTDWDGMIDGCPTIVPEDLDRDGRVYGTDLGLLLSAWGLVGEPAGRADINGDGVVDGGDFSRLLAAWTG